MSPKLEQSRISLNWRGHKPQFPNTKFYGNSNCQMHARETLARTLGSDLEPWRSGESTRRALEGEIPNDDDATDDDATDDFAT